MRQTISTIPENTIKRVKRIALAIVFCIPVVIAFGYITRNVITSNALQIICFMVIFGLGVLIEETIYYKKQKKLEEKQKNNKPKDVFK